MIIKNHPSMPFVQLVDRFLHEGGTVLEVGCSRGETTIEYGEIVKRRNGRIFLVDWFNGNPEIPDPNHAHGYAPGKRDSVRADLEANLSERGLLELCTIIPERSDIAINNPLIRGKFDIVFIDAGHEYPDIKSDILNYREKVKPGGILCGHDFDEYHPGVIRAVQELVQGASLEMCRDFSVSQPQPVWWAKSGSKNAFWLRGLWPLDHPIYKITRDNMPNGYKDVDTEEQADLVVAPTRPWYKGDKPWILLIEDWVTLFHPHLANGRTEGVDPKSMPVYGELKELFARPNFRGIACHHPGTFNDLRELGLTDKVFYYPIGVEKRDSNPIGKRDNFTFLFINTFKAGDGSFVLRGGEIVLAAFKKLVENHPDLKVKLKVLSGIEDTVTLKQWAISCPKVQKLFHYIEPEEYDLHLREGDCLLQPAHRVHANTMIRAMSYGMPVVISDGWGLDEYVKDVFNGKIVKGVNGHTSWRDNLFRENYSRWQGTLSAVDPLYQVMLELATDRVYSGQLGARAYEYVRRCHTVESQTAALSELFV